MVDEKPNKKKKKEKRERFGKIKSSQRINKDEQDDNVNVRTLLQTHINSSMGLHSRNTTPSRSSSLPPRCVPLLVFLSIFALIFFFNLDTFVSQTRAVARHSYNEQTRLFMNAEGGNLDKEFEITWGEGRAKVHNNGGLLTLSLDKQSGSGFRSRDEYLFGKIEMQIKLISGNSAGTVTTYYLSSEGPTHDEIDFEFLGNSSGEPYTLHTNVYCQGKGHREQQFFLWFDPTVDFHTYAVLWNPQRIVFFVDGTPIREFKNLERNRIPFPKNQPMRVYSSLWNGDEWATRGGLVKTDWTKAPFTASYRNYKANACVWSSGASSCRSNFPSFNSTANSWTSEKLNSTSMERLKWVQKNYMVYNYCVDKMRFPEGLAPECKLS